MVEMGNHPDFVQTKNMCMILPNNGIGSDGFDYAVME